MRSLWEINIFCRVNSVQIPGYPVPGYRAIRYQGKVQNRIFLGMSSMRPLIPGYLGARVPGTRVPG
eukprot:153684-Rhodomonas_salina.2